MAQHKDDQIFDRILAEANEIVKKSGEKTSQARAVDEFLKSPKGSELYQKYILAKSERHEAEGESAAAELEKVDAAIQAGADRLVLKEGENEYDRYLRFTASDEGRVLYAKRAELATTAWVHEQRSGAVVSASADIVEKADAAVAEIDRLAKATSTAEGIEYFTAYAQVIDSPVGRRLYALTKGARIGDDVAEEWPANDGSAGPTPVNEPLDDSSSTGGPIAGTDDTQGAAAGSLEDEGDEDSGPKRKKKPKVRKDDELECADDDEDDVVMAKSVDEALELYHPNEGALTDLLRKNGVSDEGMEAAVQIARLARGFGHELPAGFQPGVNRLLKSAGYEPIEKADRLSDIRPDEVSLVDRPANRRRFHLKKDRGNA